METATELPGRYSSLNKVSQRNSPFWVEKQLVLYPLYRSPVTVVLGDNDNEAEVSSDAEEQDFVDNEEGVLERVEEMENSDDESQKLGTDAIKSSLDFFMELVHGQKKINNIKFLEKFAESYNVLTMSLFSMRSSSEKDEEL